ncbi:MAG: hypothetical protein AAFR79_08585 [Pseudomonadota bacterium]
MTGLWSTGMMASGAGGMIADRSWNAPRRVEIALAKAEVRA